MKTIILSTSIFTFLLFSTLIYSRPTFNGNTPGCSGSGCHTFQDNKVQVSVNGFQISITVTGTTQNVAGEIVSNGVMLTYNNSTSQNPFVLTAPQAGTYLINAGHASSLRWDSVTVYLLPPTAPNNLTSVVNLSAPSVQLNWTDNSTNETGFIIEREILNSGNFVIIDTVGANVLTYTDTTVDLLAYRYRIKSYNVYGHSVYSNLSEALLPVELVSFEALSSDNKVLLSWQTATELNNKGFEIERRTTNNDWIKIGFTEGRGTTTEQQNYSFTDDVNGINVPKLYYRLKQIDFDGSYKYSDIVEVSITPMKFSLCQNYPNPFNPDTKIGWLSPISSHQTLKVYDVQGREVATLFDEYRDAGNYEIEFNASELASGIYYYQLKADEFVETRKMILIK